MIEVKLRDAMGAYSEKHQKNITYRDLATLTGISKATLEAIGSRPDYNTTLAVIDAICSVLDCEVSDLVKFRREQ